MSFTIFDGFSIVFVVLLITLLSNLFVKRNNSFFSYSKKKIFVFALTYKILFSIIFCFVFINSGDAFEYYDDALEIVKVMFRTPKSFITVWFGEHNITNYQTFSTNNTSMSFWTFFYEYNVARICVPFIIFGLGSYWASSILIVFTLFIVTWKIYEMIIFIFPSISTYVHLPLFFLPSVSFWCGGMLKDTFALIAISLIIYSLLKLLVMKKMKIKYILCIGISIVMILLIKPYILIVLLPSIVVWLSLEKLKELKSLLFSVIISPFIAVLAMTVIIILSLILQDKLGSYGDYENLQTKAEMQSKAFDRLDVKSNQANLINNTVKKKIPNIFIINFKPFFWESWNKLSFLSSIENSILLVLLFVVFWIVLFHIKGLKFFLHHPFIVFLLIYSLLFSYALAISVSNYGALMRFKTAYFSFFITSLYLISSLIYHDARREIVKKL